MAIDMRQFYQVFFEEAGEHIASMESLLLGLDPAAPDPEQLNAVFRAAHSIKGSAATFGFSDLAQVTHILEGLLDRIRKGDLALRSDMIDAFLAADDLLADLLAAHREERPADPAAVEAICARLKRLTEGAAPSVPAAPPPPPAQPVPAAEARLYDIEFVLADGGDARVAERLLAELRTLGEVSGLVRPEADDADGTWRLRLESRADQTAVADLLQYVVRSDSLRLTPGASPAAGRLSSDPGGAYGFFDDEAETAPFSGDDPGGAYGFFADVPDLAPVPDHPMSDAPPAAYGFFDDEDAASPTATPAGAVAAPALGAASHETHATGAPAAASAIPGKSRESSIRVGVDRVDQMVNLVGELVITQAMLAQAAAAVDPVAFERLLAGLVQLERNTRDLQEAVMSIRMMPISVVFSRFPRVVRDLSQRLGKQVELRMAGEATELDRGLIEHIADPLTHLIRNSLDHGIEAPDVRLARGKPPVGIIHLEASHQSGKVVVVVRDDGAGLNRQRILAKARERGLPADEAMSDQEVWALIFEPGFSTAETITEVSGRGVGMDVVKRDIAAFGGRVDVDSEVGRGTCVTVRLPLTLAILDAMSVAGGGETYLIPLAHVIESLQPSRTMIKRISGVERLLQVRGEYLPVVSLHEAFGLAGDAPDFERGIMVIIEADGEKAALFVDAMIGQHQAVIKSLEANYRKVPGIAGATIMGDGRVAMILDVAALVGLARSTPAAA